MSVRLTLFFIVPAALAAISFATAKDNIPFLVQLANHGEENFKADDRAGVSTTTTVWLAQQRKEN